MHPDTKKYKLTVIDTADEFSFKLTNLETGKHSRKVSGYRDVLYFEGMVVATGYYLPDDKALTILTPDEFCLHAFG